MILDQHLTLEGFIAVVRGGEAVTDEPGEPAEQRRESVLYRTPRSLPHEEGPRG